MTAEQEVVAKLLPWENWPVPEVQAQKIKNVQVQSSDEHGLVFTRIDNGDDIGIADTSALKELSTRIGFPVDFVEKLSPQLRADVVNERIDRAKNLNFSFVVADGHVTNVAPGSREINSHKSVAEATFARVRELVDTQPEIDHADISTGRFRLRLVTDHMQPVTKKVGDVLQMGVEVEHAYGFEQKVSLYTRRLVCTNGMCANMNLYSWSNKEAVSASAQMDWLLEGVDNVFQGFGPLVGHAQLMAETKLAGDPLAILIQRARYLKIPVSKDSILIECFTQEPGDTEWHILNALTRFATHHAHPALGRRLMHEAGQMVDDFEVVDASLPRSIALKVGAKIKLAEVIEEEEALAI